MSRTSERTPIGKQVVQHATQLHHDRKISGADAKWRRDVWFVRNSHPDDYEQTLGLKNGFLVDFLESRENPVVVDLLAQAGTLRYLLNAHESPYKIGIAVGLTDERSETQISDDLICHRIQVVSGDLGKMRTWGKLESALQGKKADLILERGVAGLSYLPENPIFFLIALRKIWDMLSSDDGTFIGQTPGLFKDTFAIYDLYSQLKKQGIDAELTDTRALIMTKHPGSPSRLDFPIL